MQQCNEMASPRRRKHPSSTVSRRFSAGFVDRVGALGSLLCAVHCALLPLAIALAPSLGLGLLASAGFETAFLAFATVLALVSLIQGYRRHRAYRAMMFLAPGLLIMWSSQWLPGLGHEGIAHAVLMTVGGTLIGVAHILNLRLSHGHMHDACCGH